MRRIYSRIIIILFLLACSPMIMARAEDTEGDVQWESVSSWEEMKVWLQDHERAGGNLKLTQDITITGDFIYSRFFEGMDEPGDVLIDTGAHHLIVEGNLHFSGCPKLTITGDGEIFRVAKAGRLKMTAINIENRSAGCAIYQEEGGILCLGVGANVNGEIHYAELPVATAYPYVEIMIPKEDTITEYLPSTIYTYYNYQGRDSSSEMSVEWNLEAFETQIADRQRFQLDGQIVGCTYLVPPVAEVVFFDQDITFSRAQFYEYPKSTNVFLDYYCRGEVEPQLYYSLDQETYTPVSAHPNIIDEGKGQALIVLLKGNDLSGCAEDEIFWEPGDPAISFVFGWQTEEGEQYSDVICYDGTGGVTAGKPYDGNRGGGTDLGDGDTGTVLPRPEVPDEEEPDKEEPDKEEPQPPPNITETPPAATEKPPTAAETPPTATEKPPTAVETPQKTQGATVIWQRLIPAPLVLAANVGFVSDVILSKKDIAEGNTKKSSQKESSSEEETPETAGVTKTAAAFETTSVSESAEWGDSKQAGSKMWLMILITGTVLMAAFWLSGIILKKLHNK